MQRILRFQFWSLYLEDLNGLVVIQSDNATDGTIDDPNPSNGNYADTEDGTAQGNPCKQVWIISHEKQEKERYKSHHIPKQIPPETADLPDKVALENGTPYIVQFDVVNDQGNQCQQAARKNCNDVKDI